MVGEAFAGVLASGGGRGADVPGRVGAEGELGAVVTGGVGLRKFPRPE